MASAVRYRLEGGSLRRAVARKGVLPEQERAVDREREEREKEDEAVELRHVVKAHALHQDVAQPALRREHLGEHDPQERYAEAYPQSRRQRGQYRREDYSPEELSRESLKERPTLSSTSPTFCVPFIVKMMIGKTPKNIANHA